MSAQNIIQFGFNIDELNAEKKQVLDLFVDMFGKLKEYDGTKFNPLGNGGLADLKKSITEGSQALNAFNETAKKYNETVTEQAKRQAAGKQTTSELGQAMAAYEKIIDQLAQTQAKNNAAESDAAEGLAVEREALKQRNAELTNAARLQLAEAGSINEAKAAIAQMIQERNSLNAADEANAARIKELNEAIDVNTEFIRANSAAFEKQKMNIGNYPQIVAVLKSSLASIDEQLAAMAAGGDLASEAVQRLTLEQKILQATLDKQEAGFSNINQALRSTKNALDAMTLAGLGNTEAFEKLNLLYTSAEQKVKDLHREQAILTTDAPAITALTGVARGLGGAYALGAGAAGLFADGNEKVEKELNKLVAVMTFLQGLEEAVSALKERNAIVTGLETEAIKALTFIKGVETRLFGEAKTVEVADTVAKEANTAATVESAAATTANTAALEAEAGAAASATAATGALTLRTVLIGAGVATIAAAAIGAGIALALLTAKLIGYGEQAGITAQQQKDILEATKELNEALEGQEKVYEDLDDSQSRYYANLLGNAQAAAASQYEILLAQQRSDKAQADAAKDEIDRLGATNAAYAAAANNVQRLRNEQAEYAEIIQDLNKIPEKDLSSSQKEQLKAAHDNLELNQLQLTNANKTFDDMRAAREKFDNYTQKANEDEIKFNKLSLDDQLLVTEKAEELRANLIKAKNAIILSDDRSTLDQRLAAIKSNAVQEIAITTALAAQIKDNPSNYVNGLLTPQAQLQIQEGQEKQKEILLKSQQEQQKLIVEYNDKRLTLLNEISKNELDADAAVQKAISDNDTKELDARLAALQKNIDDRTQVIAQDYALQLKLAIEHNKTQEEFDKIESDRQKALADLTANTQKEIYDTVVSYGEKRRQAIEAQNKANSTTTGVDDSYNQQVDNLNKGLLNQSVSYEKYINTKRKLDEQYTLQRDQAQIADDQKNLDRINDLLSKEDAIKLEFANRDLETAKVGGNNKEIADAQAKVDALKSVRDKDNADQITATDKLNKDKQKLNADTAAKTLAAGKFLEQQEKQLGEQSFNFAQSLVDASYEKKIMYIERETQLADQAADAEIAAVQRSTLSTRQQAEEVAIIQAQKRARDIAAQKEERAEKIAEAKFDRDVAVAKAIWAGAFAEIEALGTYGGTPYAFAIAAAIAALTAVEVATILAKPIPSYGEGIGIPGRGVHPGGAAVVGEAGPELVSIPGQEPFVVDQATLIDLAPNSKVQPLNQDIVQDLGSISLMRSFAILNSPVPDTSMQAWEIAKWQTSRFERALKRSQRRIINHIHIPGDTLGLPREYYETKIKGNRKR